MQNRQLYSRLLREFRPYIAVLWATLLALVVASLTDVLLIQQLQNVVDALNPHRASPVGSAGGIVSLVKQLVTRMLPVSGTNAALWTPPATIMALALLRMLSSFSSDYGSSWLSNHVQANLRRQMFARILRLPNDYFDGTVKLLN